DRGPGRAGIRPFSGVGGNHRAGREMRRANLSSRTVTRTAVSQAVVPAEQPADGVFAACVEAIKPGITRLVTITAAVGLILGGLHHAGLGVSDWVRLGVGVVLGTA